MSTARSSRMLHYINYRMRLTLVDSRIIVGTFMAFDRHMNLVISDSEEYRIIKSKKGQGLTEEKHEKRSLGLIILRGDTVVSMTIEGPPPPENDEKVTIAGPGVAKSVGRGLPVAPLAGAPMGLAGPIRGVGGPVNSIMQPPMPGMPRPPMPGMPGMPPVGFAPPRGPPGAFPPGMPSAGLPPPPPAFPGRGPPGMPPPPPPGMFGPRG